MTTAFAWTFSAFATPQLIGGGRVNMVLEPCLPAGICELQFPIRSGAVGGGARHDVRIDRGAAACHAALRSDWRSTDMSALALHKLPGHLSRLMVVAVIGFLLLPALVVTIAAFNDKALLSFPPEKLSLRWFTKALTYDDFRSGFWNSLKVTVWASSIALVIGAAFAFALDRYEFRFKRTIEAVLLSSLIVPHFTIGLGFLIIAAQIGAARGFAIVVTAHVVLVLPFVLRSVYVSLRNFDRRLEQAAASLGPRPCACC